MLAVCIYGTISCFLVIRVRLNIIVSSIALMTFMLTLNVNLCVQLLANSDFSDSILTSVFIDISDSADVSMICSLVRTVGLVSGVLIC